MELAIVAISSLARAFVEVLLACRSSTSAARANSLPVGIVDDVTVELAFVALFARAWLVLVVEVGGRAMFADINSEQKLAVQHPCVASLSLGSFSRATSLTIKLLTTRESQ